MRLRVLYFLALVFAALALVPSGAHLAELPNKMRFGAAEYHVAQQIYRGWALFGVVVFAALGSALALVLALRHQRAAFRLALVALLCIVGTQAIFWSFTFPVNQATSNWTILPGNWADLRVQWEYSHAVAALLNLAALIALILSLLRTTDERRTA